MMYVFDGLALSIVAKATVVSMVGLMGAWLARGSRAAVRHAVLAGAFAVMLALPIVSMVVPPVRVAVPVMQSVFVETVDAAPQVASLSVAAATPSAVPHSTWPSAGTLLLAGWLAGVVFFLLRMMVGLRQVHSLCRYGLPWRDGQEVVDRLALDAGIGRRVEVLVHESLPAPVTCGVVHPAILLPPDAQNWAASDLNRALVHELEHVRRADWVVHCLARIVCAVYWFHPLVWMAWRRLALEAERACDDAVLSGSEATLYADQLVGLARRLSANRKSPALAMASRSDLSARVGAVLDSRQRRGRAGPLLVTLTGAAAATVVVTMSSVRISAAPQMPLAQPAANAPAFEVASVRAHEPNVPPFGQVKFGPDRLTLTGVNLHIALMLAYNVRELQILGPDWMKDGSGVKFFDVVAKAPRVVSEDQLRLMLRTLLADRFHLTVHWAKKEMPVFALLVAKGGPKFHETAPGTEVDSMWLGFANVRHELIRGPDGRGGHSFTNAPMAALANALSASMPFSPEPVIDMTELPGRYDFVLHDVPRSPPGEPSNFDDMIAAQKTIVQDELGLTWERRKAPVDMLVVDRADKTPTEN
jgi:uncharacterized protein (TIGR03435 family)